MNDRAHPPLVIYNVHSSLYAKWTVPLLLRLLVPLFSYDGSLCIAVSTVSEAPLFDTVHLAVCLAIAIANQQGQRCRAAALPRTGPTQMSQYESTETRKLR